MVIGAYRIASSIAAPVRQVLFSWLLVILFATWHGHAAQLVTYSQVESTIAAAVSLASNAATRSRALLRSEMPLQPAAAPSPAASSCWGAWGEWGNCSKACDPGDGSGPGKQSRQKALGTCSNTTADGSPNAPPVEERACGVDGCPKDCVFNNWNEWSNCTYTCGGGVRFRTRMVDEAEWGGRECSEDPSKKVDEEACNMMGCPVDCGYSEWTSWASCSAPCAGGSTTRTRTITQSHKYQGTPCNTSTLSQSQACNTAPCDVDCVMSDWSEWTKCSTPCGGGGNAERARLISVHPQYNGAACPTDTNQSQACGDIGCAKNCNWGPWSSWTTCSATCGLSTRTKNRTIENAAENNGTECQGGNLAVENCSVPACPVNCQWEAWQEWGVCSRKCGTGIQRRIRTEIVAQNNGTNCTDSGEESRSCQGAGGSSCGSINSNATETTTTLAPVPTPPPPPMVKQVTGKLLLLVENPASVAANVDAKDLMIDTVSNLAGEIDDNAVTVTLSVPSGNESDLSTMKNESSGDILESNNSNQTSNSMLALSPRVLLQQANCTDDDAAAVAAAKSLGNNISGCAEVASECSNTSSTTKSLCCATCQAKAANDTDWGLLEVSFTIDFSTLSVTADNVSAVLAGLNKSDIMSTIVAEEAFFGLSSFEFEYYKFDAWITEVPQTANQDTGTTQATDLSDSSPAPSAPSPSESARMTWHVLALAATLLVFLFSMM